MEDKKINLRTLARIQAMKIIYMADFNTISFESAVKMAQVELLDNDEINEALEILPDAVELVTYISENIEQIDNLIKNTLTNYSIDRINLVDKAIVRVATAELLEGKLDKRIIINEALEITKLYTDQGDHKAVAFNNRLIDNISNNI